MTLPAGARLGRYDMQALLGAGGMGEVYRATGTSLKRAVARGDSRFALAAGGKRQIEDRSGAQPIFRSRVWSSRARRPRRRQYGRWPLKLPGG
jgi:hypothetical protein